MTKRRPTYEELEERIRKLDDEILAHLQSIEELERIYDFSLDMIGLGNLEGYFTRINSSFGRLLGYSEEEFLAKPFLAFVHEEDVERTSEALADARKGKRVILIENRYKCKDGSYKWIEWTVQTLSKENKFIAVGRDSTERKRMEEELARKRKLESLGVLAGGLAHDFNNLLTPILTTISMARMYGNPDPGIAEMLIDAEKVSLRAKTLCQQLLIFAKGGTPIKKTVDLSTLLKDTARFALSGSNVKCEYSIADNLWPVKIDEGQIGQVIHNIVVNADQAMAEGGLMKIRAENMILRQEERVNEKKDRYVWISIEDQGHGMPQEHLSKIFDPFFTTKEKGRGLGLATSLSIVARHEGRIHVDSNMGLGTVFHIYLPASDEKPDSRKKEEDLPIRGDGRVLVIDDEESIRRSLKEGLNRLGYRVNAAADHEEGIRLYASAMEGEHPFDAVIMDLTIPGSIGGQEAVRRLKKVDRDAKVIISSGYSENLAISRFREYGSCGFVAKPYQMKDLARIIHDVIKGVGHTRTATDLSTS